MIDETRYSRNIALCGADGQRKIAETKILITGLGGLGSHLAQQLAYLGVLGYGLVDHDIVTKSSLNRLIGAVEADVPAQTPKVMVAKRLIETIQPVADIHVFECEIAADGVAEDVARADVIFGCLDRDLPRLQLTELCARYGKPYFDLASDTSGDGSDAWYGGRVVLSNGMGCLSCLDLLDQEQIARDTLGPEQRAADARIYGIDRNELEDTGPAIVSVNGVVASLAMTEFMAFVTGVRESTINLVYRGDMQRLTKSVDQPRDGCWYCTQVWGRC